MIIEKIAFTGADDYVYPKGLIDLSCQHPYIEWGILLSKSRQGTQKYPSNSWIERMEYEVTDFYRQMDPGTKLNFSAHVCGKWLRDIVFDGEITCDWIKSKMFRRVQLNTHGIKQEVDPHLFVKGLSSLKEIGLEIILQWDGVNNHLIDIATVNNIPVVALFDRSHGIGVSPEKWDTPIDGVVCGYAGGLGPDNIETELKRLRQALPENYKTWIDMETKVRGVSGFFDMSLVKKVISLVNV